MKRTAEATRCGRKSLTPHLSRRLLILFTSPQQVRKTADLDRGV